MLAALWLATSPDGQTICYRSIEESDLSITMASRLILKESGREPIEEFLAPPDLWNRDKNGVPINQTFSDNGVPLRKVSNERIPGWLQVKEYLRYEKNEIGKVTKAPKIDAVVRYTLDHLSIDPSYKVIVFVTWLDAVDTLVSRFQASGVKAVPFTGELPRKQREDNKTAFQTDPDVRVFVSSDAGGYGVNLPQANLLINVDLPWSAGALKQRNGRVQRASSNWKSVVVQDFLMDNSLDVRQHAVVHQKTAVASALLDKEGVDSAGELVLEGESLLRFLLQAIN
jgi:superfamily II DNA or RNA helicase